MPKATDKVQVQVLRWVEETVTLKDLLLWQIVDIRHYHDDEFDIYYPYDPMGKGGLLYRAGTIKGLTDVDLELFKENPGEFWDKHIEKIDDLILGNICKIPNYQFRSLS